MERARVITPLKGSTAFPFPYTAKAHRIVTRRPLVGLLLSVSRNTRHRVRMRSMAYQFEQRTNENVRVNSETSLEYLSSVETEMDSPKCCKRCSLCRNDVIDLLNIFLWVFCRLLAAYMTWSRQNATVTSPTDFTWRNNTQYHVLELNIIQIQQFCTDWLISYN